MKSRYVIPIAVFVSAMLLMHGNIEKVFADTTLTFVDPTGDGLTSTQDCIWVVNTGSYDWMMCDTTDKLLIYLHSTHAHIANITDTGISVSDVLLGANVGNCVYFMDSVDVTKYCFNGTTIVTTGTYTPANCVGTAGMDYDDNGYIWLACDSTSDRIHRFNPSTMTNYLSSPDLTDAVGIDCDDPKQVAYTANDDKGIIHCETSNTYVSFQTGGLFTVALLDDEPERSAQDEVLIDGKNNRFIVNAVTGVWIYDYNPSSGIITALGTNIDGTDYTGCAQQRLLDFNIFFVCISNSVVDAYYSNATSAYKIFSGSIVAVASGIVNRPFWSNNNNVDMWMIPTGQDNQEFYELTGLSSTVLTPPPATPPPASGPNDCDGDGTTDDIDPDIDGDGLPNLTDPNTDCDALNNDVDTDDDGDGILDVNDPTPFGNTQSDDQGQITDIGTQMFCSFGINKGACTDTNVKTNGVGLAYLAFAIIFSYLILVYIHYRMNPTPSIGGALHIHPLLLLMVLIVDVGLAWKFGWIEDLIFYTVTALMVGLAGFGLYRQVRGGGNE